VPVHAGLVDGRELATQVELLTEEPVDHRRHRAAPLPGFPLDPVVQLRGEKDGALDLGVRAKPHAPGLSFHASSSFRNHGAVVADSVTACLCCAWYQTGARGESRSDSGGKRTCARARK